MKKHPNERSIENQRRIENQREKQHLIMKKQSKIAIKQPSSMPQEIMKKLARVQLKLQEVIAWQMAHSGRM